MLLLIVAADLIAQQAPGTAQPEHSRKSEVGSMPGVNTGAIGDEERSALTFTRYDLDLHLRPADAGISVVARVKVRNDGEKTLPEIAIQISSSLRWDGVSQVENGRTEKLRFNSHPLQSDADHTGEVSEIVIHLLHPVAAHETAELALLYSGEIRGSAGLSMSESARTDWDLIYPEGTYLRGFGNVLWFPVASPQVFVSEGANLLYAAGQQMSRQSAAAMRLRVSVEYTGDSPEAVFFCGRELALSNSRDGQDAPVEDSHGIATALFPEQELGFRTPTLLITRTPVPVSGSAVALVSGVEGLPGRLSLALTPISAFLGEWFGQGSSRTLNIIDHPGDSLIDAGMLVAPVARADTETLNAELVPALTHTRFRSSHLWLNRGMPAFVALLWTERTRGRAAALASLADAAHALALAESVSTSSAASAQSLSEASDAVYYESKAAFVFWMLRDIVGENALKQAVQRYLLDPRLDKASAAFEKLLEDASGKNLSWFFEDWVYHDRGLPDLSILSAAARQLPSKTATGAGRLVAVEVRNDGGAAAEVPVTVRSGTLTATERLRIDAHSVASVRILFQGDPEQVQVNDGTVPEMIANTHTHEISSDQSAER